MICRVLETFLAEDHGLALEFGQADAAAPGPRVFSRHEQHHRLAGQGHGVEAAVIIDARHHGDVGAVLDQVAQHRLGIAHGHGYPHPRVAPDERGQQSHDEIGPVGAGPQMTATQFAGRGQQLLGLFLEIENASGDVKQAAPEVAEGHLLAAAMEQAGAVALLQSLDLDGDRRLAHPEEARRLGKAAFGGDRVEGPDLRMVHKPCISRLLEIII